MNTIKISGVVAVGMALGLMACQQGPADEGEVVASPGAINTSLLLDRPKEDWITLGGDYQQSYHSPLTQINKTTVKQLGFAWEYKIDTLHGFQGTPIVSNGVMYGSAPGGSVHAVNAKTGEGLWSFQPDDVASGSFLSSFSGTSSNRGVAVWEGMVYVASFDGYLYGLDAADGSVSWKVDTFPTRDGQYTITGAPYVAKDVVVIGNGGADFGVRGYVTAYDLKTGAERWRFYTVPGDPKNGFEHPEMAEAIKTWSPESRWDVGVGGTAWDAMAYDPKLNLLYVGTGNSGPWPRQIRSPGGGDNLYVASILAINPDTGRLAWHYQATPGDQWDYTSTQKMIMADLEIEGRKRQVIMQAPKNGFFYVLDRKTGELISAEPYVNVTWASHIDMATGKPVETGLADYSTTPRMVFPSPGGGHNWQPMAFNPQTGLVYIPTIEQPAVFGTPDDPFEYKKGEPNMGVPYFYNAPGPWGWDREIAKSPTLPPLSELAKGLPDPTIRGFLRAWDPVKQKLVWEQETSGEWAGVVFATWNGGGVMTTAGGLVFQGRGTGELVALDAETGDVLHSIDVGTSMMAAPVSYSIDGEQYIAIMAGVGGSKGMNPPPGTAAYTYGNEGRIVAFKLGGGAVPHPKKRDIADNIFPLPPVARLGAQDQVTLGKKIFESNCSRCHINADGAGGIPDLRRMNADTHAEFMNIVLGGKRMNKGMPNFSGILEAEEATAIHTYLIDLAWQTYDERTKPKEETGPIQH